MYLSKLALIVCFFFLSFCSRRLIKKQDISHLNEYYKDKTYYLKENIVLNSKESLKKGTSVKIWIESTPTILKVKCYPSTIDREIAIGKMVAYLINEDIRRNEFSYEMLEELIDQKLIYYLPSEIKGNR
ncbi:MAG: type II secretion system-associated lipoprotein [Leptospiraceae bacterium]|nr:type II secretion system-associated lipoprotein [Leptospiraceae bacterium]MCP5511752.1 type II secretion system-associated lipoprotein [Leptospiraceae bacterium]